MLNRLCTIQLLVTKKMPVVLLLADILVFLSSCCPKQSLKPNLGEKGPMDKKMFRGPMYNA